MNLLALFLISIQPAQVEPLQDRCAAIERNHFYDEGGRLVFSQWIFRDPTAIVAWRIAKPDQMLLLRTDSGWAVLWTDNDGPFRRVDARSFYETWEQFDPELLEREVLPACQRRELRSR